MMQSFYKLINLIRWDEKQTQLLKYIIRLRRYKFIGGKGYIANQQTDNHICLVYRLLAL